MSGKSLRDLLSHPNVGAGHVYDIAIVGLGAAGGILSQVLAYSHGLNIAGIDYGNLQAIPPRSELPGTGRTLFEAMKNQPPIGAGDLYTGYMFPGVGGKTAFWGGFTPWILEADATRFGSVLEKYLLDPKTREAAERFLGVRPFETTLQHEVMDELSQKLPEWTHSHAPFAARDGDVRVSTPGGMYTPADDIVRWKLDCAIQRLQDPLHLYLDQEAVRVRDAAGGLVEVSTIEAGSGSERTICARRVVLCAGTLGTPRLLLRSDLKYLSADTGWGFTDHYLAAVRFEVPTRSRWFRPESTSKTFSRPATGDGRRYCFNLELVTGTLERKVFNHLNVLSDDSLESGRCLSELVFSASQDIQETNQLSIDPDTGGMRLSMQRTPLPGPELAEMSRITDTVLRAFDAETQSVEPILGSYGAVAHEVGTARIGKVVDEDLQLLGYENRIYVCDNSVFPVSPATNPTILLAALALRLAGNLSKHARSVTQLG